MKKIALLPLALILLGAAVAGTGQQAFRIEIQIDTTIGIPTLCENESASTYAGLLEFKPKINGLDSDLAVAVDSCRSDTYGDWNVTALGNVPLDIYFCLNESAPVGITVAVGNSSAYSNWYINLTAIYQNATWSNNLPDGNTLQVWQRVAADTDALGGTNYTLAVLVKSCRAGVLC